MKLNVNFENCYGIQKLITEFDFSEKSTYAIYAPNGVMKSSFANTFRDHSFGEETVDRVFKDRVTVRSILDEDGNEVERSNVFVIEPYIKNYESSNISTLLVNKDLRQRYDEIHKNINLKKEELIKVLQKASGVKKDLEEIFSLSISLDEKEFFKSLMRLKVEILEGPETKLGEVNYLKIFNDKVIALLSNEGFKDKLKDYIEVYDQLITNSTFFKKDIFNHNNAADIAKNLKDNGYFKAKHSINVNMGGEKKIVETEADLVAIIQQEKDAILEDEALAKSFEKIDKQLTKNKDLKEFRDYIEQNKLLLPELDNLELLKQKLWVAYLVKCVEHYKPLMEVYEAGKEEIGSIVEAARGESTKWQDVIDIFNDRFDVPFTVGVNNQDDVILKREAPSLVFHFDGSGDENSVLVEQQFLMDKILSNGERRALYILNIIFEVEARKASQQNTFFIIDDIADSFDYKNKYAIVEYLKDISSEGIFSQIILTHNFDFYRTISSRLDMGREHKLHAIKTHDQIIIKEEIYQNNPFLNWKNNLNDKRKMVAAIPFIRNLAEYCENSNVKNTLTSLLHMKAETKNITIRQLELCFKEMLQNKDGLLLDDPAKIVIDIIHELSNELIGEDDEVMELESKIVLSIGIRLKAEEFMIAKIDDLEWSNNIPKYQTDRLITRYKADFSGEEDAIKIMEQVNLMTPENIHLNSFMYEPILDMSNHHLKQLYSRVSDLV